MKHTICCLVENKFGVLARIAGLFSSRGFNINSLAVGETEDAMVSRMTIVLDADERILEQVIKQLRKLIDVIKVIDLTGQDSVERELMLIKVNTSDTVAKSEAMQIVDIFRAKIVDVGAKSLVVEITGDEKKVETLLELLRPFGIKELARTGKIAMLRK
ncbi:acetolactate synthase small subunit [Candidatus Desantisbacteria bacterium CG1_02_38_46]|uniref:Acetolactate synthase small subunit n=3 Tax=unclassified Candidatus Desantisiibacteriota TaxID=3106372 RepID=A0A2H9P9X4_9BACT|nr:MAG: acetolactate synthase small subunit [Candidatus Desantisbacteria bacterium CG1_02_38_46]PIU51824.1 MAG: acetolactate synthase small subunit [Candidatus Desantisbacteria bacterium CG07_land_8_20_14_0_80_39_15]PIZ15156.1 MAG: acetolactate synthase small subunit [Candidatus Desantisbacteria bacterium CG_4_10_14_0_8_um_filter_39_17]